MHSFRNFYSAMSIVVVNTLIVFCVLNGAAEIFLRSQKSPEPPPLFDYFWSSKDVFKMTPDTLRLRYPSASDIEITGLLSPPNMVQHPVLEFVERPVSNSYYSVSPRLYRSHTYGSKDVPFDDGIWVFGGSTVFGHGVSGHDSIPGYLDELLSNETVINFAVQGSHFSLDMDKLVYLLKKGYRPKAVLFINGVNDITKLYESPFSAENTPAYSLSAFSWAFNVSFFNSRSNVITAAINQLPIFQLLRQNSYFSTQSMDIKPQHLRNPTATSSSYFSHPLQFYSALKQSSRITHPFEQYKDEFESKLSLYYTQNVDLLHNLSEQFSFDYAVFIQPNGFVQAPKDFIKDPSEYLTLPMHRTIHSAMATIGNWVEENSDHYNVHDISHLELNNLDYIDIIHYSPQGNHRIAAEIHKIYPFAI